MADRQTPFDVEISAMGMAKPPPGGGGGAASDEYMMASGDGGGGGGGGGGGSSSLGRSLQIIPAPEEGGVIEEIFINLTLSESIFSTGVSGVVKIKEPGGAGDYFNLLGNEIFEFELESSGIDDSHHKLSFCVTDARFLGDESMDALAGPSARAGAGWEIEFCSCENYLLNWETLDYMDEDYIGKIADGGGGNFFGIPLPGGGEGLVDELAEKYFNPGATPYSKAQEDMEIEGTHNWVWLKQNQNMYPWGKDVHPPNLISLMNNLAENAVTKDEKGVNYLFYADLKGYHFKSIRKMIADSEPSFFGLIGADAPPRQYRICDADVPVEEWTEGDPRIQSHKILSEYDHLRLWQNGAYSSYYELVKPNYDDPYFDYIDFTTQHQNPEGKRWGERIIVDYDYHRDMEEWGDETDGARVEKYKLIPDKIKTSIELEDPTKINKKSRRKYDETGLYGYFDSPYNHPDELPYDFLGSEASGGKQGKTNDVLWQTMFDQTELEGEILKKIQKEIKEPTRNKFNEHIHIMNMKEKFNVYRHSICCDKQTIKPVVFFAWIHDAKKINNNPRGGIYEYSWKEVEMWPNEFVAGFTGGEAIISSDMAGSPLQMRTPEGGLTGAVQPEDTEGVPYSSPAYNLNELLNRSSGMFGSGDVFIGPGVNAANEDHNDYPEGYQMMPVGGFFEVGDDGILKDPCEEIEDGVHPNVSYENHGHIVQMYRIPNYILNTLSPEEASIEEPDPSIPENIYVFDVPNAHDGLCGCL